jgi:hypothetical protein
MVSWMKSGRLGRFFCGPPDCALGASSRIRGRCASAQQVGYRPDRIRWTRSTGQDELDKTSNFPIPGMGPAPEAGSLNGRPVAGSPSFEGRGSDARKPKMA